MAYERGTVNVKIRSIDLTTAWVGVNLETSCTWDGEEETGECARDCTTGRQPGAEPVTLEDIKKAAENAADWLGDNSSSPVGGAVLIVIITVAILAAIALSSFSLGAAAAGVAAGLGIAGAG